MSDIFARIVLGHLVGDYLLQSKAMALQKSTKGLFGFFYCTLHCLLYTGSVCLFWPKENLNLSICTLIFLSHFPVDRWSLAQKWLWLINGRDFLKAFESREKYREIDIAFSCLVYAVADNTIHLISLWLITKMM